MSCMISQNPSISTHTPLAGRDQLIPVVRMVQLISTHTPLAGRDQEALSALADYNNFYSHAPRGARLEGLFDIVIYCDFYSHAPRGARP